MIGLLLSALNPFKMILFWGLKKIPLLLEIPTLKDHLIEHQHKKAVQKKAAGSNAFIEVVLKCWNLKEQWDFL